VNSKKQILGMLETAVSHQRNGKFPEAEAIYRRVLAISPRNTDALYLLGLIAQRTGRFAESVELFRRATAENPKSAKYWVNLGLGLGGMGLGKNAEALEALRRAVAIDPTIPAAWSNLGNEFSILQQFEEAIDAYQRALKLNPDFADAQLDLGSALQETAATLDPPIAAFERAIALQPDFATAHWNLGFVRLLLGDYQRGLQEYEWRLRTGVVPPRAFSRPRWDGSDLAGKTILLHTEQGFGDTIHMARYIPMLAARGARVILECPRPLVRLMRGVAGAAQVIEAGETVPAFDVYCPIMSLPLMFQTRLETIPWAGAYVGPDPVAAAGWEQRLRQVTARPRVGIVWAGRPENKVDRKRSMRLEHLAPLSEVAGATLFSLQKGGAAAQLRKAPGDLKITDFTEELGDFADTAALVANLDLVIAVDTAVAHLSAALGRPTWILLPYRPDWRWMMERENSPWYPTARLFRQKTRGDWPEVIGRVKQALANFSPSSR
jgi:Tfp pilus assembly protein PilF